MAKNKKEKQYQIPDKIKIDGAGAPIKEIQIHNGHTQLYTDHLKAMVKGGRMVGDIINWRLADMHKCMNPDNIGKVETVPVENPDFDQSQPVSKSNPFFIPQVVAKFNPDKYKDAIVESTITRVTKVNQDYIKQAMDYEREKARLEKELQARIKANEEDNTNETVDHSKPLMNFDFGEEDIKIN